MFTVVHIRSGIIHQFFPEQQQGGFFGCFPIIAGKGIQIDL